MSGYTVRETVEPGPARRSALMLLPRAVLAQPTEAPERAALAPKSWYIRAETDDETQRWRAASPAHAARPPASALRVLTDAALVCDVGSNCSP